MPLTDHTAYRTRHAATLPATCNVGDFYTDDTGGGAGLYVCLTANNWTGPFVVGSSGVTNSATSGQVAISDGTNLVGDADLTFSGDTLTVSKIAGALNGTIGATTPAAGAFTTLTANSTITQTSASATAFESGPNGGTNPVLRIVNSTASQADGISITGGTNQAGTTISAISSGSNSSIILTPKGTGALLFGSDGSFDIGAIAANRPRYIYPFGISVAGPTAAIGEVRISTGTTMNRLAASHSWLGSTGDFGISSGDPSTTAPDTVLKRAAVSVWAFTDAAGTAGTALQLPQKAATPANPASSAEANFYIKGNKIVFQYNDAGTVRYVTYDLTQSATALWSTSTSAP